MIFILVHKINVYRHWRHRDAVRGWTACDGAITCLSFPLQRHIKGCIWILPCDITELLLETVVWHHRAVSGYHPDTTGQYLDIILWHHSAVSGYHPDRAISGYHSVTSQGCIWISSYDITTLYLDIILIKCCIWISPWSQYYSWILSCDITGLYLDIVLWHHSAISGYHSVTVTSEGPFPSPQCLYNIPATSTGNDSRDELHIQTGVTMYIHMHWALAEDQLLFQEL